MKLRYRPFNGLAFFKQIKLYFNCCSVFVSLWFIALILSVSYIRCNVYVITMFQNDVQLHNLRSKINLHILLEED